MQVARGYFSGLKHHLLRRKGIRVLCYHGVVERKKDFRLERNFHLISDFQDHLRFLRSFRVRILSMTELVDELIIRLNKKEPAVVITFDDGYANNLIAAEILHKWRIPWTLFISTGAIGQGKTLWTEELALLLLYGNARRVEVLGRVWSLETREERETAFQEIRYSMKKLPAPQKQKVMEEIRQQFSDGETQRLLEQFSSFQMLTWEEVQQLASAGVEIGSHGVDHEIHHSNQPEFVRRSELTLSKKEIEERLGRPCCYFAYPNGDFV
ncbi:MAG: polysaccharide deacetylase family protein, partial [Armatimonadetes bacterium]|nr:polysaccharide deacetylase family protein [Armatimonadota bacterium]